MFWDINKTCTYNCLFNFILGNRGGGKTYGFKKRAISNFLKKGEQFIYLRRYKEEIKPLKKASKFINDVAEEFSDVDLEVKGDAILVNGDIAGWILPLSTAVVQKSTPFPRVTMIGFDEFIIDKGSYHYLPNEVTTLLEFYETVARMRDNVKIFFMANAVTQSNPYFIYFDIMLPYGKTIYAKNDILIELVQNEDYIKAKEKTRFGKIIKGTAYGDYAIENKFLRDNDTFIAKRTDIARYYMTFLFLGKEIGVWIDYNEGKIYCSDKVDPSCKIRLAITDSEHKTNTMLTAVNKPVVLKNFINNYAAGNVRFETIPVKNMVLDIMRRC